MSTIVLHHQRPSRVRAHVSAFLQPEAWTSLQEWHGEPGTTVTDRLTTHGPTRVAWSLVGAERNSFLDIYVRDADGRFVRGAVNLPGDQTASPSGTFALSDRPGVFFLEIISTNARWRVAVEQAGGGR